MDRSYGSRQSPELISCKTECGSQSIVKTLDQFLQAFERMRTVIMVPSCLRDMDVTVRFEQAAASRHEKPHRLNGVSRPSLDSAVSIGSSASTSAGSQSQRSGRSSPGDRQPTAAVGDNDGQLVISNGHTGQARMDLHKIYTVLHAVHNELTNGSNNAGSSAFDYGCSAPPSDELDGLDAESARLAQLFRTHLDGLFAVVQQMTSAADYVAQRYQSQSPGGRDAQADAF